jgi:hypothetical protein
VLRNVYTADQYLSFEYRRFMTRALATEMFDFADEADEPEATCPVCKDREQSFWVQMFASFVDLNVSKYL